MTRNHPIAFAVMLAFLVTGSGRGQTQLVPYNHLPSGNRRTMAAAWTVRSTDHFDIFYEGRHERVLEAIARASTIAEEF